MLEESVCLLSSKEKSKILLRKRILQINLDISLEQSLNGNLYSNDEVIKRTKEWLNSK